MLSSLETAARMADNVRPDEMLYSPVSDLGLQSLLRPITKTRLFKYIENFTTKNWKFSDKNSDIFHISA